ncbi:MULTISPECIES: outer membrane protein transport protein [unclassified Shewanella]|uniref:outer membrane protein transport protein n=1 Tax=unclassified Shewanella TaxID=196818 RepID=UPI000C83C960|nr:MULTISPECIES: outer membrane protein transport protein [unclassified Shewanella]MDO6618517.1 outer membrane protein transport protein [Shewanella sp. 6_MG-2023]PMG28840.1 aromatic hydrocarbon degradation protein [Shewanella sp. 10N.286.52.C2]PMG50145.1 aromatic hydrocarbon degradation protein [Shewanella sp. 10N.286.52.B9]
MKKKLLTVAVSAMLLGATTQVSAAGFQLAEYSSTGLGRAFAGEAAMADNAGAQTKNPAMLTYLEGRQLSAGAIYIMPNVDVLGETSISSPLLGADPIVIPSNAIDFAGDALIPNFYYSNQLNDNWTWGLAFHSNYGLATELDATHSAAIFGDDTAITTVEFNPNIGYKINDAVSIGAGLRIVYGEGNVGASMPGWIDGIKAQLPDLAPMLPAAGTSLKYMEGDDIAIGWKIGSSWQINDKHRLGFAYHSGVELELDGHASGLLYDGGQNVSIEGYLPIEIPAFAELASHHQLTENWAMHASVNWTQWSVFDELVAYFPGETKPIDSTTGLPLESDLVKEENFKDNWRFAVGTTYQLNDKWLVRGGMALDQGAAQDEYRSTTIPDSDRLWFSAGAGYQASKNLTVDFAITYIKGIGDAPIDETQDLLGLASVNYSGDVEADVWLAGVQFSYKM